MRPFLLSVYWNVYGECDNFHVIPTAHSGAIVDLHFSHEDGRNFYTASTDKTVGIFDTATGQEQVKQKLLWLLSCIRIINDLGLLCQVPASSA